MVVHCYFKGIESDSSYSQEHFKSRVDCQGVCDAKKIDGRNSVNVCKYQE